MRYLVFANTPAHVHLYKHVVDVLRDRDHEVMVMVRDYGCTVAVADAADLPYHVYGGCGTTKLSLLCNLPGQYVGLVRQARAFDPDVVFGVGSYAAHAGAITGARTILVLDSEPTTLDHRLSSPFADALLTPACFRRELGPKHHVFEGFKESAYLHPGVYSPDESVRNRLGVGDDRFVVIRLNAFGSHHDVAEAGFSRTQVETLVETLADHATVVVSDEGDAIDLDALPARPVDCHPADIHHVLSEAALLVADSQTMVTEAAMLGTPAIRSNSFVGDGDMGNFLDLADRGLVRNLPSFEAVREEAKDLLTDETVDERWARRRQELLAETVDLTDLLVDVAERPGDIDDVTGLTRVRPAGRRTMPATSPG
jgi:predicted glycosyltransferase